MVVTCAKLGPHGLPCVRCLDHHLSAALAGNVCHRDVEGRAWTDVNVTTGQAWAPPPVVAPTVTKLAAQVTERLATLDRVRPLLSAAIKDAPADQVPAMTILAVEVSKAILRGGA